MLATLRARLTPWLGLVRRAVDLLGLFCAMFLSDLLVQNMLFGGAVYITGEVWVTYARIFNKRTLSLLPSGIRAQGLLVFILAAAMTVALVFLFPYIQSKPTCLLLTLFLVGGLLQQIVADWLAKKHASGALRRRAWILAACHAAFLAAYVALFWLNRQVVVYPFPRDIGALYAVVVGLTLLLLGSQCLEPAEEAPTADASAEALAGDALLQVRSYRIYNKMTVNTAMAVNLSITAFICYMRFLPYSGFFASTWLLVAWLALIALATGGSYRLLSKRYLARHDRPIVFLTGLLFWAASMYGTLSAPWRSTLVGSLLNGGAMGVSLACMLSIILIQSHDMKTVIELGAGKIDNGAYRRNTEVMLQWSMLVSYLLLLVMLCIASFIMEGKFAHVEAMREMRSVLQVMMLVLPMAFVIAAMIYAFLQPLDRNYADKLKKYRRLQAEGRIDAPLEARLRAILVGNAPQRLAVVLLKPFLRRIFPAKVVGSEHVDLSGGGAVFICNHLEIYGPIISVIYSPFPVRPWVIGQMLDPGVIIEHMTPGADKTLRLIPTRARRWLVRRVVPILIWILDSTDPIAVHRGTLRGAIQTIQESVEALTYDDNVLIFPEQDYQSEGVAPLIASFVQIGKSYYQRTGKRTTFYPMYISRRQKRLYFGPGITFDPDNEDEKDRIVNYLYTAMNQLAGVPVPADPAQERA